MTLTAPQPNPQTSLSTLPPGMITVGVWAIDSQTASSSASATIDISSPSLGEQSGAAALSALFTQVTNAAGDDGDASTLIQIANVASSILNSQASSSPGNSTQAAIALRGAALQSIATALVSLPPAMVLQALTQVTYPHSMGVRVHFLMKCFRLRLFPLSWILRHFKPVSM